MYRFIILLFVPFFVLIGSCQQKTHHAMAAIQVPSDPNINAATGKLFLAKNKLKPGVHTLPSGLQFSIYRDGSGIRPNNDDLVTVYYQGSYINGTIFDHQHAQSSPVTVRLSALIPGWQEALQMMLPGSIWILYLPPDLAYGERGVPGMIGPNQTLIYTVHLLKVVPQSHA